MVLCTATFSTKTFLQLLEKFSSFVFHLVLIEPKFFVCSSVCFVATVVLGTHRCITLCLCVCVFTRLWAQGWKPEVGVWCHSGITLHFIYRDGFSLPISCQSTRQLTWGILYLGLHGLWLQAATIPAWLLHGSWESSHLQGPCFIHGAISSAHEIVLLWFLSLHNHPHPF